MAELLIQPSLAGDPNAVALARLPERITDLDVSPLVIYDLDQVAASALPYLAEQFNLAGPLWEHLQGEAAQREAIRRAISWHRAKGTPWAITEALGWIGVAAVPDDLRSMSAQWATYELVLEDPPQPSQLPLILSLARFAAPARSHLVRLYTVENDVRPIVLDRGPALDTGMLDGFSGVRDEAGVVQSYGERRGKTLQAPPIGQPSGATTAVQVSVSRYDDVPVLDTWRLDSRVLAAVSGGVMELRISTSNVPPVGDGARVRSQSTVNACAWEAPAPVAFGSATSVALTVEPIHPPRHWSGPWGGQWRGQFQLISKEN